MKNVRVIEVHASSKEEGLKQLLDQLGNEAPGLKDIIGDILSDSAAECMVDEGREAVNEAARYIDGHTKAADRFLKHLPGCRKCAEDIETVAAVQDIKAKSEAALEALKAFAAAEQKLENTMKQKKGVK